MNGLALHSTPYNVLELCAGVGGLGLGIHIARSSARAVCYVERECYAAATLAARMEAGDLAPAPIWDDLGSFDGRRWRGIVDCVASGDPCQPNSVAGKRAGSSDDRWLIDQVLRLVDECRPDRVFRENVTGNSDGQLEALVPALESMGYSVAAGIFSAAEIGASHKRERLFIMADRQSGARSLDTGQRRSGEAPSQSGRRSGAMAVASDRQLSEPRRRSQSGDGARSASARMADAASAGREECGSGTDRPLRNSTRRPQPQRRSGSLADSECARVERWRDARDVRSAESEAQSARHQWQRHGRHALDSGSADGMADAGGTRSQRGEFGGACDDERLRPDAHGSAAELRGTLLFAPGPSDARWPEILDADPLLAPAIGAIDLWSIARRNLGIPPLVGTIGRCGGMARDLDPATTAKVKSEVRRIADGLANRLDSLRACGNGVYPLAAAVAWLCLELTLERAGRSTNALVRAA